MKKAVSMISALVLTVTAIPVQPVWAWDSTVVFSEQDRELEEEILVEEDFEQGSGSEIFDENTAADFVNQDMDVFTDTEMGSYKDDTEAFAPDMESDQGINDISADDSVMSDGTEEIGSSNELLLNASETIKNYHGLGYVVLEDGTAEFIGIIESEDYDRNSDLVIPDSVDGHSVSRIGDYAFENENIHGNLVLPKNLVSIGRSAFKGNSFSGSLVLPEGLKSIEDEAFYGCRFEGDLILPESIERIGDRSLFVSLRSTDAYEANLIMKKMPQKLSNTAMFGVDSKLNVIGKWAMREGEKYKNYVRNSSGTAFSAPIISEWRSSNEKVAAVDQNGIVTAVGPGEAEITATAYNGATGSTTLYVKKKAEGNKKGNITWKIPERIRLGYEFNQPTRDFGVGLSIAEVKGLPEDSVGKYLSCQYKTSGGAFSLPIASVLENSDKVTMNECAYARYIGYYAVNPGTITYWLELWRLRSTPNSTPDREKVGEPYTVTIEEPVIVTNEPKQVNVGDKFTLRSELKNTDLKNEEVSYYKNKLSETKEDYYCYGDNLVYEPEFIIESGANLLKRSKGDFSQTLKASEQLEFTGAGTVKIKVRYKHLKICSFNGDYYSPEKTITIQVKNKPVKVSSVKVNKSSLKLKKGQSYTLKASLKPTNASNKAVTWTSSNKKVAVVKNGKVTAKGIGTAVITAKAADGSGKSGTCKVTVGYTIKYQLNKGKNVSGNPSVYYKQNITLKKPLRAGYLFKGWYTDKKYKKKITRLTTKTSGNLTLYAKWEKISVGATAISSLGNVKGNKAALKFKGVSKASGYQVVYGTDAKLKKYSTLNAKKNAVTISGLQKKKTYYVKVRAYRIDSAGEKVYGKYSAVRKVTIKK